MITVNQPRENGRTTFCRQFTYNPKGEYNSRRDGAIVSGMPVEGTPILDAPLETLVRFGTIYGQPIVWRIADFNHNGYPQNSVSLFTNQIYKLACMDAKESDRTSGRNYYPWSNVRSWLNSDAGPGEWFVPMHSTDAPPNAANVKNGINPYDTDPGFLNGFSVAEREIILPTQILIAKSSTDGGGIETIEDKAFVPCADELGKSSPDAVLGEKLAIVTGTRYARMTISQVVADNQTSPAAGSPTTYFTRTPNVSSNYGFRTITTFPGIGWDAAVNGSLGIPIIVNIGNTAHLSLEQNPDGSFDIVP